MYIYHALINALSTHMIHINLNMIFYTHVEHSPTKTSYIKYYLKNKKKVREGRGGSQIPRPPSVSVVSNCGHQQPCTWLCPGIICKADECSN